MRGRKTNRGDGYVRRYEQYLPQVQEVEEESGCLFASYLASHSGLTDGFLRSIGRLTRPIEPELQFQVKFLPSFYFFSSHLEQICNVKKKFTENCGNASADWEEDTCWASGVPTCLEARPPPRRVVGWLA